MKRDYDFIMREGPLTLTGWTNEATITTYSHKVINCDLSVISSIKTVKSSDYPEAIEQMVVYLNELRMQMENAVKATQVLSERLQEAFLTGEFNMTPSERYQMNLIFSMNHGMTSDDISI